jgi:hypothetical protein
MYKKLLLEIIKTTVGHYYNGVCYDVKLDYDKKTEIFNFTAFYVKNGDYNVVSGIVSSIGTICVNQENEKYVPWYTIN